MQAMIQADGTPLVLVHFVYPRGTEYHRDSGVLRPQTAWAVACKPNANTLHSTADTGPAVHRSDDPRAVTCPFCQQTKEFKEKMALTRKAVGVV